MSIPFPPPPIALKEVSFNVTVKQGRNLVAKDTNLFGKKTTSDPLVKVSFMNTSYGQTKVQNKTTSPIWNEQFPISVSGEQQCKKVIGSSIQLTIWDNDRATSDDPMGVVFIPCRDLIMNAAESDFSSSSSQWYPVQKGTPNKSYYCKNATGELEVSITFQGTSVVSSKIASKH